jgi:hypothetical protein
MMKNRNLILIIIFIISISIIVIAYFSLNSNTLTDDKLRYSVTIPNQNWSLIKDFEKISIMKSDFPNYTPDKVIGGVLVENEENRLYIQIYKDEEIGKDLTNIVVSEMYYAENILKNGELHFPDSPGDIVILEWVEENREINTREIIIKQNQLVYIVYYEISFSEKNTEIGKDLDFIFRSVNILE